MRFLLCLIFFLSPAPATDLSVHINPKGTAWFNGTVVTVSAHIAAAPQARIARLYFEGDDYASGSEFPVDPDTPVSRQASYSNLPPGDYQATLEVYWLEKGKVKSRRVKSEPLELVP